MKNIGSVLATGMLVAAVGVGCGGGNKEAVAPTVSSGGSGSVAGVTQNVGIAAKKQFSNALDVLNAHDKANDWNDQACNETAKAFEAAAAAQPGGKFPEATYDAGLSYQRCGNDKDAKSHFQQALSDDPKFHFARAQLALYQFKADGNADAAISALEQAVNDANFQNVPALVDLRNREEMHKGIKEATERRKH